jgi:Raf kinase inhibitor-like YbhB/YbcL family protein
MKLFSDALDGHNDFDPRYTGDSDNSSPGLKWEDAPEQAQSFALVAEDPDAPQGLFTHWVIYQIPPKIHHLPAGIPPQESLPNGIRQGINSYGKLGYSGPNPSPGSAPHRYFFRLFALSWQPEIPARATREQLLEAIAPYVIASCDLIGRYSGSIQRAG